MAMNNKVAAGRIDPFGPDLGDVADVLGGQLGFVEAMAGVGGPHHAKFDIREIGKMHRHVDATLRRWGVVKDESTEDPPLSRSWKWAFAATISVAFLLGAVLAPTDPVITSAVVAAKALPAKLRHVLNLESGLNDGLALPLVVTTGTDGAFQLETQHLGAGVLVLK